MPSIQFTTTFVGSVRDIDLIKKVLENEDSQSEFSTIIYDAVAKAIYEADPLREKLRDVNVSVSPASINPFLRQLMEKQRAVEEAHKAKDNWA
jgi:hypothetical protein